MRRSLLAAATLLLATSLTAQTADEIVGKYIKTIGGSDRINAIQSIRRTGRFTGGGGFEAALVEMNKRPKLVRQEFTMQGMTGVTAYDGKNGWKIEPWEGKKDVESLSEEEMKSIVEDADLDGPLIDYQQKGNKVEYAGMEPVEGTDAYKLKVTLPSGDIRYYFMDTDYYVPIKIETQRIVRGAPREYESTLGDYKEVNGVYFPFSVETRVKGRQGGQKVTWDKIEANVALNDTLFHPPVVAGATPEQRQGQPVDASQVQPKTKAEPKPPADAKPPQSRADLGATSSSANAERT